MKKPQKTGWGNGMRYGRRERAPSKFGMGPKGLIQS